MRKLRAYFVRLAELFHRQRRDQELAEEIAAHMQMHVEDNLGAGMDPVEARRQALIKFGSMESMMESYRRQRGFSSGAALLQDLRYAVRTLRKGPGFAAAVVLSLALGIGANTAIFSLVDAVMLKFLPVKNPEELVLLKWNWHGEQPPQVHSLSSNSYGSSFSYPTFQQIQANHKLFSNTLAISANNDDFTVTADGQAQLAGGELVSGSYFATLGAQPVAGRLFVESDNQPESPPVAVIGYGYWQRRFGGNLSVIGKAVTLNGVPFTIIGVTPPEFFGVRPGSIPDVWVPLSTQPKIEPLWTKDGKSKFVRRDDWWLELIGRLQPGVKRQQALAQLEVTFQQSITYPDDSTTEVHSKGRSGKASSVLPTLEFLPGGKGLPNLQREFSNALYLLMAVVGLVLLIACANVANLLLARATSRRKEIAVRLAIGAARKRLIRQLLTESLLLAAVGGALGLGLAYGAIRLLVTLMSSGNELTNLGVRPDLRVLGFTAGISLLTGILFGLAPALRSTRLDLAVALKDRSNASSSGERPARLGLAKMLVVSQVTTSLLLVVGAGLFVRTLINLHNVDAGFNARNVLLFRIAPIQNGYEGARLAELYEDVRQKLTMIPGVHSASFMGDGLVSDSTSTDHFSIQGYTPRADEVNSDDTVSIDYDQVGADFFETMGIPLLLGRTIGIADTATSPKIAVVNEAFARKCFENSDQIGQRLGRDPKSNGQIEIVGVVGNTKYKDLRSRYEPMIFLPRLQHLDAKEYSGMTFALRTGSDPHALIPAARDAVKSLDPNLPISNIRTQVEQIDQTLFQERLFAKLSSFFGLLALVLASIGLYGVMSYSVARRTNEIGVRMALGARREDILRRALWHALALVLVGVGIGIPLALGVLRVISSLLFGLTATDPLTLAGAIAFVVAIAAIAGYLPARRAAKVDPIVALRYE